MAIQYVGGQVAAFPGKNSADTVTFSLTGGLASAPSVDDLILVLYATGSAADRTIAVPTPSGYTELWEGYSGSGATYRSNLSFNWKVATSGDLSSLDLGSSGSTQDAKVGIIMVFRGVDTTTPFDVTETTAVSGAGNSVFANPPSITPSSSGAWIVCAGAAGSSGLTGAYTSSDFTVFRTEISDDTNDAIAGMGYYSGWSSGAFDPAAFGGATGATGTNGWCAISVVLKPAAGTTHSRSATSDGASSVSSARELASSRSAASTGASTVAATRDVVRSREFAATGASTVTATSALSKDRSASMTPASTVAATPQLVSSRSAAVDGASTVSATRSMIFQRSRAIEGSASTVAAAPQLVSSRSATSDGSSSVSSARELVSSRSATSDGSSSVSSARELASSRSAAPSSASSVSSARELASSRSAASVGASTVSATAQVTGGGTTYNREFAATGASTVSAAGQLVSARSASMTSASTVAAAPQLVSSRSAAVASAATVTATATGGGATLSRSAAIAASSAVTANPTVVQAGYAFGAKTKSAHGGIPVAGTSITSGDGSGHWQITGGYLVPTVAGDTANLGLGPYTIVTNAAETLVLNILQNAYSVRTMSELEAALEDSALAYGDTVYCRTGNLGTGAGVTAVSRGALPSGTYSQSSTVKVRPHDGAVPVLRYLTCNSNCRGFDFDGVTFDTRRNAAASHSYALQFLATTQDVTIQNCRFIYDAANVLPGLPTILGTETDVLTGVGIVSTLRFDRFRFLNNYVNGALVVYTSLKGEDCIIYGNEARQVMTDGFQHHSGARLSFRNNKLTDKAEKLVPANVVSIRSDGGTGMIIEVDKVVPTGTGIENAVLDGASIAASVLNKQWSYTADFDRTTNNSNLTTGLGSIRITTVNYNNLSPGWTGGGTLYWKNAHADLIQVYASAPLANGYDDWVIEGNQLLTGQNPGQLGFNTTQGGIWANGSGMGSFAKNNWRIIGNLVEISGQNGIGVTNLVNAKVWSNVVVTRYGYDEANNIDGARITVGGSGSAYDNLSNLASSFGALTAANNITGDEDNLSFYTTEFANPPQGNGRWTGADYDYTAYLPAGTATPLAGLAGWDFVSVAYVGTRGGSVTHSRSAGITAVSTVLASPSPVSTFPRSAAVSGASAVAVQAETISRRTANVVSASTVAATRTPIRGRSAAVVATSSVVVVQASTHIRAAASVAASTVTVAPPVMVRTRSAAAVGGSSVAAHLYLSGAWAGRVAVPSDSLGGGVVSASVLQGGLSPDNGLRDGTVLDRGLRSGNIVNS